MTSGDKIVAYISKKPSNLLKSWNITYKLMSINDTVYLTKEEIIASEKETTKSDNKSKKKTKK